MCTSPRPTLLYSRPKQADLVQQLRHCEEHSDEAIFFSHQPCLQLKPIWRKAPLLRSKTGSFCTSLHFGSFCTHAVGLLYTGFRAAKHGSKPRASALHDICCMETIYVSLCDTTNIVFLNRTPPPFAFAHTPKTSSHCASFTRFVARQILQGLQIKPNP